MRTDGRTVWRRITAAALAVAGALGAAGCGSPGELHDGGRTRAIASHPTPQALWPDTPATAPSASSALRRPTPAPAPLQGISVPSADLHTVSATTVLAKDPALERDERLALQHCTRCEVRPPQYRDLTGDGRPELITAVTTQGDRSVLHVYTLRKTRIVPILDLPLALGFSAQTVGLDLVVQEPTTASIRTSSTYHWDGSRLAFTDRQIKAGPGSTADALACTPGTPAGDGGGLIGGVGASGGGGVGEPSAVPVPFPRTTTVRPTSGRPQPEPTTAPSAVPAVTR